MGHFPAIPQQRVQGRNSCAGLLRLLASIATAHLGIGPNELFETALPALNPPERAQLVLGPAKIPALTLKVRETAARVLGDLSAKKLFSAAF